MLKTLEGLPTPSFLSSKMSLSSFLKKIVYIITVTFLKTPIINAINLNTIENKRILFGNVLKTVLFFAIDVFKIW